MKIGLYNLEPKIFNVAMMKVSQYHKILGDKVENYNHLFKESYNKIYAFSLFDFTPKTYVIKDMICGGTGFNIYSKLPNHIETCGLDYSIFPECETSYVWFSKGCFRNCPFCVVPKKEGMIRPSWEVEKNLNPKGKYITVLDNNFFGCSNWEKAIDWLVDFGQKVDFTCGFDVRIFNDKQGEALNNLIFDNKIGDVVWKRHRKKVLEKIK